MVNNWAFHPFGVGN